VSARPTVLVVLPTLGRRNERLRQALASIDAQRVDVDLTIALVVPTDAHDARALGREFGALLVDDPGRGMSAAMNAGRSVRTTEQATIWLGDDDSYVPGGLAHLYQLLTETPDAAVAYGACHYVDSSGRELWTSQAGALAAALLGIGPNLIPHPAAMIRIDALEAVGGYDETLSLVMDLDVFLKLRKRGRLVATTTPVAVFGWHEDSLTVSGRLASEKEARAVKKRHLPVWLRPVSGVWEWPVAWASRLAARTLNRRVDDTLAG
jgi:GT2 family glycosyltransferase